MVGAYAIDPGIHLSFVDDTASGNGGTCFGNALGFLGEAPSLLLLSLGRADRRVIVGMRGNVHGGQYNPRIRQLPA